MYMNTLSLADARAQFSKIVESASSTHERFEVTKNGSRAAVLLGADDYDSLIETLEILADPETMKSLRQGIADLEAGDTFDSAQVLAAMKAAGRLNK